MAFLTRLWSFTYKIQLDWVYSCIYFISVFVVVLYLIWTVKSFGWTFFSMACNILFIDEVEIAYTKGFNFCLVKCLYKFYRNTVLILCRSFLLLPTFFSSVLDFEKASDDLLKEITACKKSSLGISLAVPVKNVNLPFVRIENAAGSSTNFHYKRSTCIVSQNGKKEYLHKKHFIPLSPFIISCHENMVRYYDGNYNSWKHDMKSLKVILWPPEKENIKASFGDKISKL